MPKVLADCRDFRALDRGGPGSALWGGYAVLDMEVVPRKEERVILPPYHVPGADQADVEIIFEVIDVEHYPYPSEVMEGCKVFLRLGRKG